MSENRIGVGAENPGTQVCYTAPPLAAHFPVDIQCDHENKRDRIQCDCGHVTDWWPSVFAAKVAWAEHALGAANEAA